MILILIKKLSSLLMLLKQVIKISYEFVIIFFTIL
jgi:hypothetical protein